LLSRSWPYYRRRVAELETLDNDGIQAKGETLVADWQRTITNPATLYNAPSQTPRWPRRMGVGA
jgi:hypothetical protein